MKLTMVTLGINGCMFTDFIYIAPSKDGKCRLSNSDMDRLYIKNFGRKPRIGENINIG